MFSIAWCLYLSKPLSFSLFCFSTCGSYLLCFEADLNWRLAFLISNTSAASLSNIIVWFNALCIPVFSDIRFEGTDIVARIVTDFLHPFRQIPWNVRWLLYTILYPFKIILLIDMVSPAVCLLILCVFQWVTLILVIVRKFKSSVGSCMDIG